MASGGAIKCLHFVYLFLALDATLLKGLGRGNERVPSHRGAHEHQLRNLRDGRAQQRGQHVRNHGWAIRHAAYHHRSGRDRPKPSPRGGALSGVGVAEGCLVGGGGGGGGGVETVLGYHHGVVGWLEKSMAGKKFVVCKKYWCFTLSASGSQRGGNRRRGCSFNTVFCDTAGYFTRRTSSTSIKISFPLVVSKENVRRSTAGHIFCWLTRHAKR